MSLSDDMKDMTGFAPFFGDACGIVVGDTKSTPTASTSGDHHIQPVHCEQIARLDACNLVACHLEDIVEVALLVRTNSQLFTK